MHRSLPLLALLVGCAPILSTPEAVEAPPVDSDTAALNCATSPFEGIDFAPDALRLTVPLAGGVAGLSVGVAHPDSQGQTALPHTTWTESLAVTATDDGLTLAGETVALEAWPRFDLGGDAYAGMWEGTLTHPDHGEQDVYCWTDAFVPPFAYEPDDGSCRDVDGEEGLNALPVPYVRETLDAQCGIFWGLMLNEDNLSYPTYLGVDLRGAQLGGSSLYFANLLDSRFEGADLEGFDFGYAELGGTVDEHTVWPEVSCAVDEGAIECMR